MQAGPLQILALVAILAFSVVGTVVGVRLLLLARRTGEIPERALGLCLVMIATVGYPISLVGVAFTEASGPVRALFTALTAGPVDVGIVAILLFSATVFRPASRVAQGIPWAGAMVLAMLWFAQVVLVSGSVDAVHAADRTRALTLVFFGISAAAFGWSAAESLLWMGRMRKRVALGLGDPVVADRFRLWFVWGVSTTAGAGINLVYTALGETIHHPVPLFFTALCGFVNAGALVLAFFPPAGYLDRVRARAV